MNPICPNCGESRSVHVHGHDQCARCGCVLMPCCNGDCAMGANLDQPRIVDGVLPAHRAIARSILALGVALLVSCAGSEKTGSPTVDATSQGRAAPDQNRAQAADAPGRPPMVRPLEPALSPHESYAKGVRFLIDNQNDDGSWGSFVSLRTGDIYLDNLSSHHAFHDATSALCLMALQEPSRHDPAALIATQRGLAYMLQSKPAGRASGGTFYDTWTHTYMIQTMARYMQDERFAAQREQIAELGRREIKLLGERQMLEGGFGYYDFNYTLKSPSGDQSTSFNSAAALIALHEAQQAGLEVPPAMIAGALGAVQRLRLPSGAYVYGEYARNNPAAGYNKVKGSLGRSQPCNLALWMFRRRAH